MGEQRPIIAKIITYIAVAALVPLAMVALTRGGAEFAGRVLERRYPPPGRMIPVADYRLQLFCIGTGSPTVIVEPGMGVDWVGWRSVIAGLTPFQRVCVYDRAGYGWSDRGPQPRTALREAQELHTMLTNARIAGPYILAAHSFGAYIARIYASRYRNTLAGVVLVEPSHEDEASIDTSLAKPASCLACRVLDMIPPLGIQRLKRLRAGYGSVPAELRTAPRFYQERYLIASSIVQLELERNEFDSLPQTRRQVRQAVFPSDLPLRVITAVHDLPKPATLHSQLHRRLAALSRYGQQIVAAKSGHMVPLDQPELIVDQVRDLARQPRQYD